MNGGAEKKWEAMEKKWGTAGKRWAFRRLRRGKNGKAIDGTVCVQTLFVPQCRVRHP